MDNLWCSWCKARAAQMVDEGGAPKCYECEVRLQAGAIQLLRDMLANAQASRDDLRKEHDELIANAAAGAFEIAKSRQEEREYRAQVCDLRDQIGERDGVIAQLRASLDALQARYDERGAKVLEVIADNDALRAKLEERERDGALVSKVAQRLREAGVESPDLPDDYDVTALVARLKAREEGEVKVGDRVVWRTHGGDLTGVVVDTWQTPDGLCCQVKDDKTSAPWGALSWTLEVVG